MSLVRSVTHYTEGLPECDHFLTGKDGDAGTNTGAIPAQNEPVPLGAAKKGSERLNGSARSWSANTTISNVIQHKAQKRR